MPCRARPLLFASVVVVAALSSCGGGNQGPVKTVTVHSPSGSSAPRRPIQHPTKPARPQPSGFVRCDSNIEAKAGSTSCGFAGNVFWAYWTSKQAASIPVWSPATQSTFQTSCTANAGQVVCATDAGAVVRFSQAALDSYSSSQADAYGSANDLGPDPYEGLPGYGSTPSPPTPPPTAGQNIPNYNNGRGYRVQCNDGMYSHSGGIQGACSGHGGVR
jgi:hypothetical protein